MKFFTSFFCALLTISAFSQKDTIFTVKSEQIICVVKNVNDRTIKYNRPDIREDLDFNISAKKVSKIVFGNGKVIIPNNASTKKSENLSLEAQKSSAIKLNFSSPAFSTLELSYERNLNLGKSIEFVFAYKGTNILEEVYTGYNFRLGYKFLKDPIKYLGEDKYAHILKGTYIKPEISYSYLTGMTDLDGNNGSDTPGARTDEVSSVAGALMLNFGNQFVYSNSLLVDIYMGLGYGFTTDKAYDENGNELSYSFRGGYGMFVDFPHLAFTAGIRVGILL